MAHVSVDPVGPPASSAGQSDSGSKLPALPISDRDYLAEARAIAQTGRYPLRDGRFPVYLHLLAYEHFVRTLTEVIAEKQAVIDALSGAQTESREREG